MSNPGNPQDDEDNAAVAVAAGVAVEKAEKKDSAAAVAGESTGGVDIEALALKVYALLKQEVRIERERSLRN